MSGGWTPIVNLFSQSGGKLEWDESNSFLSLLNIYKAVFA